MSKWGLILEAKDALGRKEVTRYGVDPDELEDNIDELLSLPDVAFVELIGRCYTREFHKLDKRD
jgi:hypothetical protein